MPPRRKRVPTPSRGYAAEKRDLPVMRSLAESEAERQAFFARAWKQHHERQAAEKRGETYVPDWQKRLHNPVFAKSIAKKPLKQPLSGAARTVRCAQHAPSSEDEEGGS